MAAIQNIDEFWSQDSGTIRQFLEAQPSYEQLSSEIAYILCKRVKKADIECSAVTHRAKTLNSFQIKLSRKHIKDPFKEIDDLAGVRIVYLYKNDFDKISTIINEEFMVLKIVDKSAEQDPDRFGYHAVHFIVQLSHTSSGARYDDLKSLRCEIQVRSVLQDAWAIVSHHLVYKREADIPIPLKRKLNALSAVFENADDQFDSIRVEREQYVKKIEKSSTTEDDFLALEINVDTVAAFLKKKFPDHEVQNTADQISMFIEELDVEQYSTLSDLSNVLRRTNKAFEQLAVNTKIAFSAVDSLGISIALIDKEYRELIYITISGYDIFNLVEHLVED